MADSEKPKRFRRKKWCEKCGKNLSVPAHTCPYKSDLDGDYTLCNCCAECTDACADEL